MADPTNRWTQRCSSCGEYWWDAHACPHALPARQMLPAINPTAKTVQEMADEITRLRDQLHLAEVLRTPAACAALEDDMSDIVERLRVQSFVICGEAADEITRLREQLYLAEVARAAQVEGLAQGAAGWRERSEQLAAEVAGLREALLQCGESGSIFDVRSIVRGALAARKGEA
jgi:hypothetical protein